MCVSHSVAVCVCLNVMCVVCEYWNVGVVSSWSMSVF